MNNKYIRYVILINKQKDYNLESIQRHVEHLKKLHESSKLVLCGPFQDYDGGIVIINADSIQEAKDIAESDPFISEGYSTYELRTLELSSKENQYLLI